jgi:hypothetical protein
LLSNHNLHARLKSKRDQLRQQLRGLVVKLDDAEAAARRPLV